MLMGRIYLIIPYYGSFPTYFQQYLDSISINLDILTVLFLTDINTECYKIPANAIFSYITLEEIRERVRYFIKTEYQTDVKKEDLVKLPYKLCDFRPVFFAIFADKLSSLGLTFEDFVGWGDCDVIYGKLGNFIDLSVAPYSFIGRNGHFTTFRYTEELITLYKNISELKDCLLDNDKHYSTDEVHIRKIILEKIETNKYIEFPVRDYYCDILPVSRLVATFDKKAFIRHLIFDRINENLSCLMEDGSKKDILYTHLRKRRIKVTFDKYNDIFYIKANTFELVP